MLATIATTDTMRRAYLQELNATIAQAGSLTELPELPWSLLALNATFYLDSYLTTATYRSALTAAIQAATVERHSWPVQPAPAEHDRQRSIERSAARPAWYRWLFDQASSTGNPAQWLLAQHICEITEVVEDSQVGPALRLGQIAVPRDALPAVEPSATGIVPSPESIERLSRELLRYLITARRFAESLLLLHAARRAYQLTGVVYAAPIQPIEQALVSTHDPARSPKRLQIVQRHDLAQRAITSGNPLAILTVEAGLVEAEDLRGGPQLLLLAALDRAIANLI